MSLLNSQLVAFEKIVECKTVHGAAKALHLTQTAITQRLRALEQKLKTTLFIRTRSGMRLTSEGQSLYRYCQRINELAGETLASIRGSLSSVQSRIAIAGSTSIIRSRIIPQCQHVMRAFPSLYFTFLIKDDNDISQYLKSGEADIVTLKPEQVQPEMQSKIIKEELYVLVCSSQWKRRNLRDIISNEKIIDFNHEDQLTYAYLKKFDLLQYVKNNRHFVNNTESIARLCVAGIGYGVLTKEFAHSYLKSKELMILNQEKNYAHRLTLAWYKRPEPPAYFSEIIKSIY